ncbi:hypothetical protein ACGFY8_25370 [Streptomyces sp. NPDC048232]|uniref:hypothetical protein n=1 Tax=Streptomyces sp. NPDC048232 TaxID=3365520 RepID=UPI003722B369
MSAPTYTRPPRATRGGADSRLPWWALALPVLAFVTLLLLILNPADAQAATEQPAIAHLLERLLQLTVG